MEIPAVGCLLINFLDTGQIGTSLPDDLVQASNRYGIKTFINRNLVLKVE